MFRPIPATFGPTLSCSFWTNSAGRSFVAGVPPDYFSATGQLWGNPVYNWDALRATGYRWCIDRLRALLSHVDLIRLDHFRGFAAAWHIPSGPPRPRLANGSLGRAPASSRQYETELGRLPFIAEDLGLITPDVRALRDQFQVPGTRVLQFAFDGHPDNPYLPENFVPNTVVYTGTHDNPTTRQWYEELPSDQRQHFWNYLKRAPGETLKLLRRCCVWHGRRWPRWPLLRSRIF